MQAQNCHDVGHKKGHGGPDLARRFDTPGLDAV